ncbi:MAG: hypothetical protein AAFQ53_11630 [Bacteroidota bacterium]
MQFFPVLRRLTNPAALDRYADASVASSGLEVPRNYLHSPDNKVFGVFFRGELIGGFLLGAPPIYRTLSCIAESADYGRLLAEMQGKGQHTEICCFFIELAHRRNPRLNLIVWLYLTYAIRRHSRAHLLFGTNSSSLAKLYGRTHRSRPFYTGTVGGNRTFVFHSTRSGSVRGMLEIIRHKWERQRKLRRRTVSEWSLVLGRRESRSPRAR